MTNETIIYVTVSVEKELPKGFGAFTFQNEKYTETVSWDGRKADVEWAKNNYTHWLKPISLTSIIQQFVNYNHINADESDIKYFIENELKV